MAIDIPKTTDEWLEQKFKDCLRALPQQVVIGLMIEHYDSSDLIDIAVNLHEAGMK